MNSAFAAYEQRDFSSAATGFDAIAGDSSSTENDRRLAHIGKALVHLSTGSSYRNLNEAGLQLQAAESMSGASGSVETRMLMNALASLISVEANISELNTKVSHSAREIAGLKAERATLVSEQAALNQALEKLKALSLGN